MRNTTVLTTALLLALSGCSKSAQKPQDKSKTQLKSDTKAMSGDMDTGGCDCPHSKGMAAQKAMAGHKGMPAPIDCPLANKKPDGDCMGHGTMGHGGMGHGGMGHHHGDKHRPFKSVAKYIAKLDQKDRASWQKPEAVITALKLKPNAVVADVGAGSGYFALRIAKRYPKGKVIAIDIEAKMLAHIKQRAEALKLTNVTTVLSTGGDPKVDNTADLVLIADVLHHVPGAPAWLARMFKAMKPGARLAIIEFKEGKLPKGPPEHIKIPRKKLLKLLTDAGFTKPTVDDKTLPYQLLVILQKP